ncbi:3-oxoacyl-[acyl-carrier-protein] synthase 2 [Fusobacterium sp. DD29]|uniref:beta-ketoacyl-ACP synthase II n=1 Tax=unclassified Fusobacterium TaxID=2648384 RepID=UPI001B8ADAF0|nr:3-oxoacyl-[acyl-carrier-protein] synthase 2 [Fusobacterium sp. DD45]MBR8710956.1 3-oxoacyl-[acyl-carrier-protein] synthase 2 [Fusobacterium sp. DD28]MBR8750186.1 3-oxoacyl-[acyl-carrier-protein] synthase 2 [Fusobacterium sp. DD29]MBR8751530.1 3-oxoacyl-[acyl-carrier-protein] synthase 2 [Fusobacterium sp. DD26]MBR8762428.1 3-oxoacyl-[acyl-carrier-protein] synthase 2 [Fusobacterium sp. DD25]MBR8768449.1 3-oxoacyl-[acyl-carrier-protein] synthase 2 [Fusobacterium sp. DD43]MBR8772521.1 3-oxoacy
MNRVVVTGIGLITALGTGLEKSWKRILNGETGINKITSYDTTDMPVQIAAEVKDFDPLDFGIEKKEIKKLARNTQFAIAATKMALADANFTIDETNADEVGVIVSSGIGGIEIFEAQHETMLQKGVRRISPFTIPGMIANMAAGNVAIYFGAKGPNKAVVTACAAGTHSVGDAFEMIKSGRAKAMIAGGTEAAITPFAMNAFANMKALSTRNDEPQKASRPFSLDRDGFVMGEGAGILILEELESAKKRGAKIYAEVVGYGETCDAYHITAPADGGEGAVRAFNMALKEGNIKPEEVGYINAHGTSTPANDRNETAAIKAVFKDHAKDLLVSSTKGATGHGLGSAGGMEAVFIAKVLADGVVPPTINYDNPDPECDLNYVPNKAVNADIEVAMSSSLGFGGHNAVIAMRKYK